MPLILNNEYFNDWIYNNIDNYSNKLEVYYGGAGSGKSHGAVQKVILKAFNEKRKTLVIRKIQRTIKNSIWALFLEQLSEIELLQACRVNKSDFEIELPNGSIFLFSGLDDPEKVKSIQSITDIVIEEATELSLDDFTQLLLRLRPTVANPQIYLMFNPVSKLNWVYDYFIINPPDNAKVIHTNYQDNRFLSKDYISELERLRERNPAYYRIYTLGEFATLDKLVFPLTTIKLISEEEVKGLPIRIAIDFGYTNDPSALIVSRYDKAKRIIYITGEYVKKGMLNNEIAQTIIDLGLHKETIYADSAEPKSIDEIKLHGINMKATVKGKDSVINGIQWLQQHEIVIDERCFKTREEFENYTWVKDKKTGEYTNKPVDTYNHTIDALRYAYNREISSKQSPKLELYDTNIYYGS